MFSNIGKKIMGLAATTCVLGIIASVIMGIAAFDHDALSGFLIIVIGSLLSWVGAFALYGFGRLIDNSSMICYLMGHPTEPDFQPTGYVAQSYPAQPSMSYAPQQAASYAPQQPVGYASRPTYSAPQAVPASGWKCKCGRIHQSYETSCVCGTTKMEMKNQ